MGTRLSINGRRWTPGKLHDTWPRCTNLRNVTRDLPSTPLLTPARPINGDVIRGISTTLAQLGADGSPVIFTYVKGKELSNLV
jgi:hypothetical protein